MVDLRGLSVLVTRPGGRGAALSESIRAAGGSARHFPAMQIVAVADSAALRALARSFPRKPLTVFISPNAAIHGSDWLRASGLWDTVTANRVAAVGEGTAQVLRELGIARVLAPDAGSGAAALLALPALASLAGTQAVVFQGEGGKETLASELAERGAVVHTAVVYRRIPPAAALTERDLEGVDIVVTSSREGLENLYVAAEAPALARLRGLPMLVSSEEAARSARNHGQRISPIITPHLSNHHLLEELARWRKHPNRRRTPPAAAT